MRIRAEHIIRLLLIFFVFGGLVSCKVTTDVGKVRIKPMTTKKIYNNTLDNYLDYNNLNIKASVKVKNDDKTTSFKTNIKMRKDSVISISITPALGIELFRVLFTPDSLKFLNRLDKEYYVGDYKLINDMFHVEFDYHILQSILTNEVFVYPNNMDTTKVFQYFKSSVDSLSYCLENEKEKKLLKKARKHRGDNLIYYGLCINPFHFKIENVKISDLNKDIGFNLEYKDFDVDNIKSLPKKMEFVIDDKSKMTNINIKYSKVSVDKKNQKYNFKVPVKYERINK